MSTNGKAKANVTGDGKNVKNAIVGYLDAFGRAFCPACISARSACRPVYSNSQPRAFERCKTCGRVLQSTLEAPAPSKSWHGHVVLSETGEVLGVYGALIRDMAEALAQRLREEFPSATIEVASVELPFRPAIGAMVKR
jgi:hypothetical protein